MKQWRKMRSRKGIMGIGVLIIFIATILVSAVAAGVMIKSTGLLQERALSIEEATRERLVSSIEVFSVYAQGNETSESVADFEFYTRLRAGSTPIQLRTLGLSFIGPMFTTSAMLNTSKIGSSCQLSDLQEDEWCFDNRLGDNDTVLRDDEFIIIRYHLNESHRLGTSEQFQATFLPQGGAAETLELRTPNIVSTSTLRIR
jgi:archaellin